MVYKPTNISGGPYPVQTMAIEIVDIPNKHGDFPVRYVNIFPYQDPESKSIWRFPERILCGISMEYL